ncbi:MAG: enoyl-CoA hydratase/isomerase family protein [Pseudomonadales bacterium]
MNQSSPLLVEQRDSALWLTLNRPDTFNALTPTIVRELDRVCARAEQDGDLKAIVITGAGPAFCAGADLKAVLEDSRDGDQGRALRRFLTEAGKVFSRVERLPVPTVAAIHGVTLAGGLELALCCDFILANTQAKFGEGHAKYAQLPGGGGSIRLPRRIGVSRAKYLMFTGTLITAEQALSWGLVDQVVSEGALQDSVQTLLGTLADKSPIGLSRMKALVTQGLEQPLETALNAEIDMCELHSHSHDRNEGLAAFAAKRKPVYSGK